MAGTIKHSWNGTVLTITSDSGSSSCDLKGEKGDDGARGATGSPGGTCYTVLEPGRNALDNSYFKRGWTINQRGNNTYTANGFCYDRWYLWRSGTAPNVNLTLNGLVIDATDGTTSITQRFPVGTLKSGTTYTLVAYLADGTKEIKLIPPATWGSNTNYEQAQYIVLAGQKRTLAALALYEGEYTLETAPPYQYKGYAAELAECQRYYRKYSNLLLNGVSHGANSFAAAIDLYSMRVVPTLVSYDVGWFEIGGVRIPAAECVPTIGNNSRINIATTTAMEQYTAGCILFGSIELNAELV